MKSRLLSIVLWSVIAAAFIGPGTLVAASTAGANFGLTLSWTLLFATLACITFQEMAARLTLATGKDLAETLVTFRGRWLVLLIPFAVILGCAAYEAGNILGAAVGARLLFGISKSTSILLIAFLAGGIFMLGSVERILTILGILVAVMGIAFIIVAFRVDFSYQELFANLVMPDIPNGSDWIVLGLIGTTVVPYNLFLGSGIGTKGSVGEMRFGLIISVALGGLISLAVLITGTMMVGTGGLPDLIAVTGDLLGTSAGRLVAVGLFAAGFTSTITAALAAGFILKGIYPQNPGILKTTAFIILFAGTSAGILDYTPEVIILAAQAANGLILPVVAILLWIITNQPARMKEHVTPLWINILAFLLTNVMIMLGTRNLVRGVGGFFGNSMEVSALILLLIALPITCGIGVVIWRIRKG